MKNKKIFLTLFFLQVIIISFAGSVTVKNNEIYNIKYFDGKSIYYLPGVKIISSTSAIIKIKNKDIILIKGRIWVTATKREMIKISFNKKDIIVNGASVDLNSDDNLLFVFNGVVYVSGKRVSRGQLINLKNKETSFIKKQDEWQKANIEMETSSVLLETNAEQEIKEIFGGRLVEAIKNNYWTMSDKEPEFLVKINIAESDNRINGTITHIISGQIIGVIDEQTEEKNPVEINAINTGARILDAINSYKENELYNGKILVIETSDLKNGDLVEFRKMLANISGLKIIEEKSYYNIKNVFKLNYIGNGYDIAEIIKDRSKKINIFHISKNNIKIKVQN